VPALGQPHNKGVHSDAEGGMTGSYGQIAGHQLSRSEGFLFG
jgi:hypothetical protein